MAIVIRIKLGVRDSDGELSLPRPAQGRVRGSIRLWKELASPPNPPGRPETPTDKYLVIGDDLGPTTGPINQRYGEPIQSGHSQRLDGGWQQLLTDRNMSIDAYLASTRAFVADLAVPATIVDSYTG